MIDPQKPHSAARAWLTAHRRELAAQHRRAKAAETRWSWTRLATFIAAWVLGLSLGDNPLLAWTLVVICAAGFVAAVRRHLRVRRRRQLCERLLQIADESLRRCDGKVVLIRDHHRPASAASPAHDVPAILPSGSTWPLSDQEQDDLDLYAAPVGVFGLLNRTSAGPGARRLRDWLENPLLDRDRITARQECVRWLAEHPAERLLIMAAAAALRGQDNRLDALVHAIHSAAPLPSPGLTRVLRFWSVPSAVLTLAFLLLSATGHYEWLYALAVLMGLNGLAFMQVRRGIHQAIEPWRNVRDTARNMLDALRQAAEDLPDATELATLRARSAAGAERHAMPALCNRLAWTDGGGMMQALCNHVFFLDLHVAEAVLHCALPHRQTLLDAAGALADLEALAGLACFAGEQPVASFPVLAEEHRLDIVGGTHPLIDPEEAVANDLRLNPDTRTWIISGSNMAGKSTFLRMTGVNLLLAQLGSAVTARQMVFSPHCLLTDLQIRDNLARHESYFLAEVRQLRRMLVPEAPATSVPILGLIDEPFRGTNSEERIAADLAVVGELIDSPNFFLVATHEQRLSDLAGTSAATSHHFHEDLTDHGAVFDYLLRPGPATQRNALRILEREGYPASVLARAHEHLGE